jgi:glucose-6-phosphate dehydrogenase assembly protein OpcA
VAQDLDGRGVPASPTAHSVGELQEELSRLWARTAAARADAARMEAARVAAQAEAAARAAAALAASEEGQADGHRIAARSSFLNLVVIAGDRATAEACAATIAATGGQHPSRSLIISEEDPNGPPGLDAWVETLSTGTASRRVETGAEMIHVTARGEAGHHLASIIVPLLVHDLPVAMWWPMDPPLNSHRADRLLPIADRLIVDGASWTGNGLELLGQLARVGAERRLTVVDYALLRQARWREALASVYDLPDLLPHLRAVRSVDVTYSCPEEGDPAGRTNVIRPLYHVAWLASRLGMSVSSPLQRRPDGRRVATLRQKDHAVEVSLAPVRSELGEGSTVRVTIASRLRGAELRGDLTADERTVSVVVNDKGRQRVRRTYNVAKVTDVELLVSAVEEATSDPLAVHALDAARRLLG